MNLAMQHHQVSTRTDCTRCSYPLNPPTILLKDCESVCWYRKNVLIISVAWWLLRLSYITFLGNDQKTLLATTQRRKLFKWLLTTCYWSFLAGAAHHRYEWLKKDECFDINDPIQGKSLLILLDISSLVVSLEFSTCLSSWSVQMVASAML